MNERCRKFGARAGFTLLEMMIALAVLGAAYITLMETQSASIRLSTYGKRITVATLLAQAKMEEVEETLFKEGFPDMDDSDEGDFEDMGYPSFKWDLEVRKVELPLGEAMTQMLGSGGGEGGASGMLGGLGGGFDPSQLEGMIGSKLPDNIKSQLGGMGGMGGMGGKGGIGGAMSGMLNPDMLRNNVEMLSMMIEQALREVSLTVYWGEGGPGKELVLTTHLVKVPEGSAAAGAGSAPGVARPGMGGKPGMGGRPMPGAGGSKMPGIGGKMGFSKTGMRPRFAK